jgi:glycosyltransferase involved in cell wall biosynthesis
MKLSVVIPAYNEEEKIGKVIQEIKSALTNKGEFEIIVVDDGSKDSTAIIAEKNGAKVLRHPFNLGYGASLKSGIKAASYQNIVFFDADDRFYPEEILKLAQYADKFDMIIGCRKYNKGEALSRTVLRWIFTFFTSRLVGRKFRDVNCGFRLVKRDLLLKILPMLPEKFSATTTMSILLYKEGCTVVEVPIRVKENKSNKLRLLRDGLRFPYLALRMAMYYDPFKVFSPLAFLFLIVGLVKSVYDIFVMGKVADSSILLAVSGLQLLVLALLGDLIVKTKTLRNEERH